MAPSPEEDPQVVLSRKLLILWLVVTVKESFLEPGGLSNHDLVKIATQLDLPDAAVKTFVNNAQTDKKKEQFRLVAKDFPVQAENSGGYNGPDCPKSLDVILSLAKGIQAG